MAGDLRAQIPGGYIAEALETDRADDAAIMHAFLCAPGIGRIRITARRMKHNAAAQRITSGRLRVQ